MKTIFKITVCQTFKKWITYKKDYIGGKVSYEVLPEEYKSEDEAKKALAEKFEKFEDFNNNNVTYNPNGVKYIRLNKNTYKLVYSNSKNYRLLSYNINEVTIEEEEPKNRKLGRVGMAYGK